MVIQIIPHKWQDDSLNMWVNNNYSGIDLAGTGTGKTISAIIKILKMRKNTLIVVPTEVLLKQWEEEIKKFVDIPHDKIGFYYGKKKEIKPITIAIVNSVAKSDYKFDEFFKFIIIDEIHNITENYFDEFLKSSNFKYKLGLSATIKRNDGFHKDIIDYMGGVNYVLKENEAKEKGYINKFTFVDVPLAMTKEDYEANDEMEKKLEKYTETLKELTGEEKINQFVDVPNENPKVSIYKMHYRKLFAKLKDFLFNHYMKNRKVIELVKNNRDKKILCFNEFNKNAQLICDILNEEGIKTLIINSTNKKHLKSVLEKFQTSEYNVLISTKVLDEGYNLPDIDMGIIVAGNQSERQIKQRVGRIIRKKEKPSIIYQLYMKGTRDERYADTRRKYIDYADDYLILQN